MTSTETTRAYDALPVEEREWEFDLQISQEYPIYTRANTIEVYPWVVTPFYATTGYPEGEWGWQKGLIRFGAFRPEEFDPGVIDILGIFGGYAYLNVSRQRVMSVRMPGFDPGLFDRAFFGSQISNLPPYQPRPQDEDEELSAKLTENIQWALTAPDLPELEAHRRTAFELRQNRPDLASLSDQALVDRAFDLVDKHFEDFMATHFFVINCNTVPQGVLAATLGAHGLDHLIAPLLSGVGDVSSAVPAKEMWKLAQTAGNSTELVKLFDQGAEGLDAKLRASDDPAVVSFVEDFDAFLLANGSRGTTEWDYAAPIWETHPDSALIAIDRMRVVGGVDRDPEVTGVRLAGEREEALAEVRAKLADDAEALQTFEAAQKSAATWVRSRERSKTSIVQYLAEIKVALREVGIRMTERGHFTDPTDIVWLGRQEFPELLADPSAVRGRIRARREHADYINGRIPPFIINGSISDPSTWPLRSDEPAVERATAGEVLTGLPACAGKVTGTARVVLSADEGIDIEPGDILIAPGTDPGWTPLFLSAAAVVVDTGAPLSHAAIVSRELGIACVVACEDATTRIPTGSTIEVDGSTGQVRVISLP